MKPVICKGLMSLKQTAIKNSPPRDGCYQSCFSSETNRYYLFSFVIPTDGTICALFLCLLRVCHKLRDFAALPRCYFALNTLWDPQSAVSGINNTLINNYNYNVRRLDYTSVVKTDCRTRSESNVVFITKIPQVRSKESVSTFGYRYKFQEFNEEFKIKGD